MDKMMDYFQISIGNGNDQASRSKVSKAKLLDIITDTDNRGNHLLIDLQCPSGTKAYLLVETGFLMTAILDAENNDESRIIPAPLFFYPLGLKQKNESGETGQTEQSPSDSAVNDDLMTPAQRRYIFRLLAEKKQLKGKQIEEYLRKKFNVLDIGDIDKRSASQFIDGLLNGGD